MSGLSQKALIALGSNEDSAWGDPRATVQKAMLLVSALSDGPVKFSGFFSNPAFPAGAGPDYVNAAMAVSSTQTPAALLRALHEVEQEAGRKRSRRWGQRTLDIDLIAVGDLVLPDLNTQQNWRDLPLEQQQEVAPDELILPHPRLQDRAFVLVPLLDVAPDWQHPVLGLSITEMSAALPAAMRAEVVRIDAPHSP